MEDYDRLADSLSLIVRCTGMKPVSLDTLNKCKCFAVVSIRLARGAVFTVNDSEMKLRLDLKIGAMDAF